MILREKSRLLQIKFFRLSKIPFQVPTHYISVQCTSLNFCKQLAETNANEKTISFTYKRPFRPNHLLPTLTCHYQLRSNNRSKH